MKFCSEISNPFAMRPSHGSPAPGQFSSTVVLAGTRGYRHTGDDLPNELLGSRALKGSEQKAHCFEPLIAGPAVPDWSPRRARIGDGYFPFSTVGRAAQPPEPFVPPTLAISYFCFALRLRCELKGAASYHGARKNLGILHVRPMGI
jgi:hypothetical protein